MMKLTILFACLVVFTTNAAFAEDMEPDVENTIQTVSLDNLSPRDPYILPVPEEGYYYLYCNQHGAGLPPGQMGIVTYRSQDLEQWEGPFPVFIPDENFWGTRDFWAPEVHRYQDKYYLFATYAWEHGPRGTQINVSDSPKGPFIPLGDWAQTPKDWQSLDGTLFLDENDAPWMVFCHEWIQVGDGKMCALPLSPDLSEAIDDPILLFRASDAPWAQSFQSDNEASYVTDGPWMHRLPKGNLIMLWSSFGANGNYMVGIARSESGTLTGPWHQDETPLFSDHGGHPMMFRTFDGQLMMAIHQPNHPREAVRLRLIPMNETEDDLFIQGLTKP